MLLRILIILCLILIENQLSLASDWKKVTRFQIAIGGERNIFESINNQISDQYFRGFLSQNWRKTSKVSSIRLNLTTWGAIYTNHSIENKYFLKLANQDAIFLKPNLIWQIEGETQIKKRIQLGHGFWYNYASTGLKFQLSKKINAKISGAYKTYKFFNNNHFNLSKYTGSIAFTQSIQPQINILYGFSLGKVTLPNRRFLFESFNYESQNDHFYSLDLGLSYQKNFFFNGFLHFEKQKSNYSGLEYFLSYSNITFAYKLFTKLYMRSNLRFQIKSYKGGFRPDQMISIDPEVGEGSNGNIDFVYLANKNISIIFRSRLLRQESIFRNKYYSNQIFEIMLEIK
jgi:hypothetical protein